jgi:hypothetical protein
MVSSEPKAGKPKRGVSLYSYSGEYGVTMTLEDMFADISDMGADGLEILANGHIEGYPEPTDEWVENWFRMLAKYKIKPVEYGHWVLRYPGRGSAHRNLRHASAISSWQTWASPSCGPLGVIDDT